MANQGVIGTFEFGGEHTATTDHPPVVLAGSKKAGSGIFTPGLLLARDEAGELLPWTGTGTLVGVCNEPCAADDLACEYLAHGTCKARLLSKRGVAAVLADLQALQAIGIFPL